MACLFCLLGLEDVDVLVVVVFLNIDSLILRHFIRPPLSESIRGQQGIPCVLFLCFPECKYMLRKYKFEIR